MRDADGHEPRDAGLAVDHERTVEVTAGDERQHIGERLAVQPIITVGKLADDCVEDLDLPNWSQRMIVGHTPHRKAPGGVVRRDQEQANRLSCGEKRTAAVVGQLAGPTAVVTGVVNGAVVYLRVHRRPAPDAGDPPADTAAAAGRLDYEVGEQGLAGIGRDAADVGNAINGARPGRVLPHADTAPDGD